MNDKKGSGPSVTTGQIKTGLWPPSKKQIRIAIAALVVLVVAAGLYGWRYGIPGIIDKTYTCQQKYTKTCALNDAKDKLDAKKVKDLYEVTEKIKKLDKYDEDPSLLAVLVKYHINLSDGQNSRRYLDILKKRFNRDIGYDEIIKGKVEEPDYLETVVKSIENIEKSVKDNIWGITPEGNVETGSQ